MAVTTFAELKPTRYQWITVFSSPYYPDYLEGAILKFRPILEQFGELLVETRSSDDLYRSIIQKPPAIRKELLKVFRQYVAPMLSQQQMGRKREAENIISAFGSGFRPLPVVRERFADRPTDDEAIIAIMETTSSRGVSGYALSEAYFDWFEKNLGQEFRIEGPRGAGRDVMLNEVLEEFSTPIPADFLIRRVDNKQAVATGFVRYDKERGGSQEDDRVKNYRDEVTEILSWSNRGNKSMKIILVNDGPGLLMGSMWDDYASIEARAPSCVLLVTLKMLPSRLTREWLLG